MSPTGQYLATVHVNNLGVYLWTNKTLFKHVSLKPICETEEAIAMNLPSRTGTERVMSLEEEDKEDEADKAEEDDCPQIDGMVTLSLAPTSRWATLLEIDLIRKRNRPSQTISAPAPFFLPTLPTIDVQFDLSSAPAPDKLLESIQLDKLVSSTAFGRLLKGAEESGDFSQAVDKLKSMGPSGLDAEVNSLALDLSSDSLLFQFMKLVNWMLESRRDFELAQAYLGLFLKVHGRVVSSTPKLFEYLSKIQESQETAWQSLRKNLFYCLTVAEALKK